MNRQESNGLSRLIDTPAPSEAFAVTDIRRSDLGDGGILLRNAVPLPSPLPDITDRLEHWAKKDAGAVLISEKSPDGRRELTYGEAVEQGMSVAFHMHDRGLVPGHAVCVIAGAGNDHALLKIACLYANLVHVPLSPALAATPSGRDRLVAMIDVCKPSLILAADDCVDAVRGLDLGVPVPVEPIAAFASHAVESGARTDGTPPGASANETAAIYFTSGSTGDPKGVRITRGMISAVHAGIASHWPFLASERPVMADWLPWHHVFGGLDNFFKMIWNGGAYHVRAAPSRNTIEETGSLIASLRPSIHIDVPFGIKMLLDHLETNSADREAFFSRLELVFFAGAGMDANTWTRLNRLVGASRDFVRPTLRITSGYGSTEAASTICLSHEEPGSPGEIGLPLPGHTLKLVDVDGFVELRVRGPSVSPGYIASGGDTGMPLDEDGFLRTGDVVAPVRPLHPELGLRFEGRIAEDFKLTNGTRVRVGALRQKLLTVCAPYLADVAIAGETREYLTALLFPSASALEEDQRHLARAFHSALSDHNAQWPVSSMAIRRAIVLDGPPDPDSREVNDKGHLVQRRCLQNRADAVKRLYARRPDDGVLILDMPTE